MGTSKGREAHVAAVVDKTRDVIFVSNNSGKPNAASRKLIRSQVMRGKNRTKPLSCPMKRGGWINQHAVSRSYQVEIPKPSLEFSGTGLSLVTFADEMQPYMLDLVFKFFTVLGQSLYPIEMCVRPDLRNTVWLEYMYIDAMYLQSTLWAAQSYFDWVARSGPSKQSMLHESKTLDLLQSRLALKDRESISDSTIAVVLVHVLIPALIGDLKMAIAHMAGLARMVSMRGGLSALQDNMHLQGKVCRADLCIALATSRPPHLFSATDVKWDRILAEADDDRWALPREIRALRKDAKVTNLWADFKCFTALANLAFQSDRKLKPEMFQDMLTSVMYRTMLLDLSSQSTPRLLHMGMLAFGATVFLQAHGVKARFENMSRRLREAICATDVDNGQDALHEIKLWSLFVMKLSAVTNEDDDWIVPRLRAQIRKNGAGSWKEVRSALKKSLWIDAIHDEDGEALYFRAIV